MIVALSLALGALAFDPGVPIEAQGSDGGGTTDLPVGIPVVYEALDGSESLVLTIGEIIDPFEEGLSSRYRSRLSAEAQRYVALRLHIENTASTDLRRLGPKGIRLLDTDTFLYAPTHVGRDGEAKAADPKLPTGGIPAGATIEGLLFYELPEETEVVSVLFAPSNDRLITLSSRGQHTDPGGTTADEPSTTEVEAPTPVQPDLADLDSTGSYDSAYFGHRVHWDPDHWGAVEALSQPDGDHLSLEGDVVTVSVDGLRDLDGDAHRCLVDQVYGDLDEAIGFDAPPDDVKAPTEDGRLPADAGLYLITPDEDGHPREIVRYVECRTLLAGEAVLRIVVTAPERYWDVDRGLVAEVLSAIELPVWSPDPGTAEPMASLPSPSPDAENINVDAATVWQAGAGREYLSLLGDRSVGAGVGDGSVPRIVTDPLPPGEVREGSTAETETIATEPQVPAMDCDTLLTFEDVDEALATWGRIDAGLDGDTFGVSGGEVCTTRLFSDESIFVRIEPGDAGDFEPGAEMLGASGRRIPAFGDEALLFHTADIGAEGQTILSVRERRDVGTLQFRLALGRPDIEEPERSLVLARLARDVLPRFPGSRLQSPPASIADGLSLSPADDGDRSHLTYVDNLQVKEEAGEWTRGEGLIATLRMFAGEGAPEEVLRHGTSLDWEATGILSMAARYLDEGTGDTEERAEIERLLDRLTWDDNELEAMAGITPAAPSTALRGASIGVVGQPRPVAMGMSVQRLTRRQPAVRTAQAWAVDCIEFFDEEAWKEEVTGVGPCLEWTSVDIPGQAADKYRIFMPAAPLPQAGWTETHRYTALEALQLSALWFEDEGNRLARAAGAPGRMPPVNVVFGTMDTGDLADAWPVEREACGVRLLPAMQGLSAIAFHQTVAHELAH